ncbi:hypothetical protein JMJ35_007605 [Cladonia borealis]|uniref:Uncharacterized protein n=1 Tax=Cladonia borealis TaxID=184061 RepID=A0AA39QXG1_9LECA|nr:hypothetical protein JMJ35_007605 [Cladonia borealis]
MHSWVRKGRKILEAVLLSFSDQQIITGLSMLIATRFYIGCSISAYHYDIVCNLVLMSVVTHLCSITFITPYLHHRAILLGIARVLLIGLTFLFAGFMFAERNNHHFPTGKPHYAPTNRTQIPYLIAPAACFVSGNDNIKNWVKEDLKILWGSMHVTGFTQYAILVTFTVFSFSLAAISPLVCPKKHPRIKSLLWLARVPLLIAAWVIAGTTTGKFMQMRAWMHESIWPADASEYDWTFGQFLPLLLMMLAGLAIVEAFSDHLEDALFNNLRHFWNFLLSTIIGKACCKILRRSWNLFRWGQWLRKEPFIVSCSESQQFLPLKGGVSSWKEVEDDKGPITSWKEIELEDESV